MIVGWGEIQLSSKVSELVITLQLGPIRSLPEMYHHLASSPGFRQELSGRRRLVAGIRNWYPDGFARNPTRSQVIFAMNWMSPEHQFSLTYTALSTGSRSQFVVEANTSSQNLRTNTLGFTF